MIALVKGSSDEIKKIYRLRTTSTVSRICTKDRIFFLIVVGSVPMNLATLVIISSGTVFPQLEPLAFFEPPLGAHMGHLGRPLSQLSKDSTRRILDEDALCQLYGFELRG